MSRIEDPELDRELYELVFGLFIRKSFMEIKIRIDREGYGCEASDWPLPPPNTSLGQSPQALQLGVVRVLSYILYVNTVLLNPGYGCSSTSQPNSSLLFKFYKNFFQVYF